MFRPLLALLLLSSLVAAQPLEGPFLVYHAWGDTAVRDLHVSIRADSLVDVFFMRVPGAVEHVVFSLSEHTASPPSTEYSPPAGCQIIEDVAPDGSTGCYVVVRTIGSSGGRWYNLSLMVGPHSSHVIFMGEADPTESSSQVWRGRNGEWRGTAILSLPRSRPAR
jgi:hypothetical protein